MTRDMTLEALTRDIEKFCGTDSEYELRLRRATALRKSNRNKEAVSDYLDVAYDCGDKKLACHAKSMLSLISIESREYKEALWWGTSAYNGDPSNLDGNTAMGLALVANDFHRIAIPYFQYVFDKDAESTVARLHLGICLRETLDFQGAHEILNQLSQTTCDPRTHYELGWNWHLRYDVPNRKAQAKVCYLEALALQPSGDLKDRIVRKLESLETVS